MVESKGVYRGGEQYAQTAKFELYIKKIWLLEYCIQSNYLTRTTLSYLQTKLAEKKQETNFIKFSTLQLQFTDLNKKAS